MAAWEYIYIYIYREREREREMERGERLTVNLVQGFFAFA